MKEFRKIIRQYVSGKVDLTARGVKDWFISSHPDLWEDFKLSAADRDILRAIKEIFNEHTTALGSHAGTQRLLGNILTVAQRVPNLPRHIHVVDKQTGVATYSPWEDATRPMLVADQQYAQEQSEQMAQRVIAIGELIHMRDEQGIPDHVTFRQHWEALRQ